MRVIVFFFPNNLRYMAEEKESSGVSLLFPQLDTNRGVLLMDVVVLVDARMLGRDVHTDFLIPAYVHLR